MSRGINKVILIGNLGADPEVRQTQSGMTVTNIRVATSETWRDKQSGQPQERTEWHRIVLFGRLGEIAEQYLRKGSQVYLEGKLQTRKWQDQAGNDRYSTEIIANEMQMLGGRGGGSAPLEHSDRGAACLQQGQTAAQAAAVPAGRRGQAAGQFDIPADHEASAYAGNGYNDPGIADDDIPF